MNSTDELLKLDPSQHCNTRMIWEKVFREDTKDFLDYYYNNIAVKNQMYVMKRESEMISMLHLNPYSVFMNGELSLIHYIVAVATLEEYRKQGIMGKLLRTSLNDMYDRKEIFTYLMPAAEAIYSPYNFVTVYEQLHYKYEGNISLMESINSSFFELGLAVKASYMEAEEVEQVAIFAHEELGKQYNIFTVHSTSYMTQVLKEQKCQNGGIVVVKADSKIIGYFYMAKENNELIRECIMNPEYEEVQKIIENHLEQVDKTKIMIRPIHVEQFLNTMIVDKKLGTEICVKDPIIERNTGVYKVCEIEGIYGFIKVEDEIPEGEVYTIEDLVKRLVINQKILLNEIV